MRGLGEAARVYFNKPANKLTVAEAALMAGMIRAPNRDNPDERAKIAKARRDAVLGVMVEKHWIDKDAHDRAVAADAEFRPGSWRARPYPYLLAALKQEFIERVGERQLARGGLRIYTAVDMQMQAAAERAVRSGTQRLRAAHGWMQRRKPLQAALLSVDPATGGFRALVGGSNFSRSQFDRTRRMRRQPGSAAKPFTVRGSHRVAADHSGDDRGRCSDPDTAREQQDVGAQELRPAVPRTGDCARGFEKSLNVPAVRVASEVGGSRSRCLAQRRNHRGSLGDTGDRARSGRRDDARARRGILGVPESWGAKRDPPDRAIETKNPNELVQVRGRSAGSDGSEAVAFVMQLHLMRGVVIRRHCREPQQLRTDGYVAGRPETTSNYRDAWFVGYVPDLLTAVWVGFDDGTPVSHVVG